MPYVTIRKADEKATQNFVANFSETEDSNTYANVYFNRLNKSEQSGNYLWGWNHCDIVLNLDARAFGPDIDSVIERVKDGEIVPLDVSD